MFRMLMLLLLLLRQVVWYVVLVLALVLVLMLMLMLMLVLAQVLVLVQDAVHGTVGESTIATGAVRGPACLPSATVESDDTRLAESFGGSYDSGCSDRGGTDGARAAGAVDVEVGGVAGVVVVVDMVMSPMRTLCASEQGGAAGKVGGGESGDGCSGSGVAEGHGAGGSIGTGRRRLSGAPTAALEQAHDAIAASLGGGGGGG